MLSCACFAEVAYDAGKNVISIRAQNIDGLEALAGELNRPEVLSFDKSTREARVTAGITVTGGKTRREQFNIGDPGQKTTLTFVCAPEAKPRSYGLSVSKMGSFRLVNTTVRAEGSTVKGPGSHKFSGIGIMHVSAATIEDCKISGAHNGLSLWGCGKAAVRNVSIGDARYGMSLSSGGRYIINNVNIDSYYWAIHFNGFTGEPTISDCNLTTKSRESVALGTGSAKMTPNITLINVKYNKEDTGFHARPGLVSIGWHLGMKVLDEEGKGSPGARARFIPRCEFEPAEILGLLEPHLESTDENGELKTDLIEGIMAKAARGEGKASKGNFHPYTYRIEIDDGSGFKVVDESFKLTDNRQLDYRTR